MTVNPGGDYPVYRAEYMVPVSEELMRDTQDMRAAIERVLTTPGPEAGADWKTWRAARREERAVVRAAAPAVEPATLERLAVRLGFGPRYTEHLMQEYCRCEVVPDSGWERCEHAIDLGIREHD